MPNYKDNYITSDEYIVLQQLGLPYEGFVKGVGYAYPLDISIAPPQMGIYNPPRFVPTGMDHYMYGRMQCLDTSDEAIKLSLKSNPEIEKDDKVEEASSSGVDGFSAGGSWATSSGDRYFAGGVGAEIRSYLTTEFGRTMFDNYWFSHGDMTLSKNRFNDIVQHAGVVQSSSKVMLSNGQIGEARVHSFYGKKPYAAVIGRGTIYYQGGIAVGFQDGYDFNWRWQWGEGSRTIVNEQKTRLVSTAGFIHGATPFNITYSIQP